MMRRPDLRVGDDDREAVAEVLKRHYESGRLSADELDARVDAAYAARYESQLVALLRDLPAAVPAAHAPAAPARRRPAISLVAGGTAAMAVAALLLTMPDGAMFLIGGAVLVTLVMAVALAPVALPLALVAWIVHALTRQRPPRQITLPPPQGPRRF